MTIVTMYTTAVCPFCMRAKQLLAQKGIQNIAEIRVDSDLETRQKMMELTGRRTVPQIFVGEFHVGGYDDLVDLDNKGELDKLLQA